MTRQEAVIISYLEWVRLIGAGAIRLDEARIVRWRSDRAEPVQVVADLMRRAPDLGTSATGFILTMLEPDVFGPMQEGGIYLGKRLSLDSVRTFHSFGDTALAIHKHDADASGVEVSLAPLGEGWGQWVTAMESADRRARGEELLALFSVPPCDDFYEASARLGRRERCIVPDDIVRSRDSMFFGWACVLNALKVSTGMAPDLPVDVKEEASILRRDFNVDQPFLAQAPRLFEFVAGLAAEGEQSTELLVMAALKQHERYVIKREGTVLDLASIFDDIRLLDELDAGASGFLVRALGERMPAELIRTLKVSGVTHSVLPVEVSHLTNDAALHGRGRKSAAAKISQSSSLHPMEATPIVDRAEGSDDSDEKLSTGTGVLRDRLQTETVTTLCDEATTGDRHGEHDQGAPKRTVRHVATSDQMGLDLEACPASPQEMPSMEDKETPASKKRPGQAASAEQKEPRKSVQGRKKAGKGRSMPSA